MAPLELEQITGALSGHYAVDREVGAGGMATVYLAHDVKHDRKVAVKVLRPELSATLGPDRFAREIRIIAQLSHPHILPLHDSGNAAGFLYFVMPFVEGESLRARLQREGQLPVHESVRLIGELVDALAYAHRHGVVHRDIKPDNVMLSGRHALVTDFGIAKAVSQSAQAAKHTTVGIALGTPAYMSPEQAMADPNVDHRADIYALGAVAYEMLAGRPPFVSSTAQGVLAAHVTEAPVPLSKVRSAVSPQLEHIVMKCLEKNAADRWQTADELIPLLEQVMTPSGGMTPTNTRPVQGVRAPAAKSSQTASPGVPRWALALIAALVLAIAGLASRSLLGGSGGGGGGAAGGGRIEKIAVMPIEDISGGEEKFVVGMHDALVSALGQLQSVGVVSRSAVLKYRQTTASVREIAKALEVDAVIEGTVFRAGNRVRVNVQMVEPATSRHIWTQSYERDMTDQIKVQDEVVKAIAAELSGVFAKQSETGRK
jgi:TolB-like protein/tRNA A-37 threonylcarbamoyl transferase component Bud32